MALTRSLRPVAYGLALAVTLHFAYAAATSEKETDPLLARPLQSLSLDELDEELQVRFFP